MHLENRRQCSLSLSHCTVWRFKWWMSWFNYLLASIICQRWRDDEIHEPRHTHQRKNMSRIFVLTLSLVCWTTDGRWHQVIINENVYTAIRSCDLNVLLYLVSLKWLVNIIFSDECTRWCWSVKERRYLLVRVFPKILRQVERKNP